MKLAPPPAVRPYLVRLLRPRGMFRGSSGGMCAAPRNHCGKTACNVSLYSKHLLGAHGLTQEATVAGAGVGDLRPCGHPLCGRISPLSVRSAGLSRLSISRPD